jgi:transcription initiation factor IIE alpha subunit
MASPLEGLFQTQDDTLEKILLKMIDEKGVSMKTHIKNPLCLTRLETLAEIFKLESTNLSNSEDVKEESKEIYDILAVFINMYRINMVSYDRKSREEITRAIEGLERKDRSLADKLMSKETGV